MKKSISIIGGGSAGIALAAFLDTEKYDVTIYEKNKTIGRKFLVAGKGGFNLTHSEEFNLFSERYSPPTFIKEWFSKFNNQDFRDWLNSIGIPTYIGSSKRVYPLRGIKPIEVLKAIQTVLKEKGVSLKSNKTWTGWNSENKLVFNNSELVESDYSVFALGGGSWKITGSDGSWLSTFEKNGIEIIPFQASNCAFGINWEKSFIDKYEGCPLKNIAISCANKIKKGEVVVTNFGLEGNAIYALSPEIRLELNHKKEVIISIDLKPSLTIESILSKLKNSSSKNITQGLKSELKLSPVKIALLKTYLSKEDFISIDALAVKIKNFPLKVTDLAKLDESISTVGGIKLDEMDKNCQLRAKKNNYCIGEMLDWDAPTGGYLLQACFSMGFSLAKHLNNK